MKDRPSEGGRYTREPDTRKITKVTTEAPAEEKPQAPAVQTARKGK
ncbi:hypothetical protein G6M14_17990 [Agrobacterium tumefaciens]|nr:hypothetical protein [Agrobacterium tumefaciens]